MKTRIAPTPSGFLHAGNAVNFLLTNALVHAEKGQLLLRIDDLDRQRMRSAYVENIFSTLMGLGIDWHQGPRSPKELEEKWSQNHRMEQYGEVLEELSATGWVYACDCSRKTIAAESIDGRYSGKCRDRQLALDLPGVAWRIKVPLDTVIDLPEEFNPALAKVKLGVVMGDFVVRKKDGRPAYQLASLVDDCYFEVSGIVRGEDLLASSAAQYYLAKLLGRQRYLERLKLYHHPLLLGANGEKLSKSAGALAIEKKASGELEVDYLLNQVREWVVESSLHNREAVMRQLTL